HRKQGGGAQYGASHRWQGSRRSGELAVPSGDARWRADPFQAGCRLPLQTARGLIIHKLPSIVVSSSFRESREPDPRDCSVVVVAAVAAAFGLDRRERSSSVRLTGLAERRPMSQDFAD